MFKVGDIVKVRDNKEDLSYFTKRGWPLTGIVITEEMDIEGCVAFKFEDRLTNLFSNSCYARRLEHGGGPW